TTNLYTLSLHDALPIYSIAVHRTDLVPIFQVALALKTTPAIGPVPSPGGSRKARLDAGQATLRYRIVACSFCLNCSTSFACSARSEEHTSELQSLRHLV